MYDLNLSTTEKSTIMEIAIDGATYKIKDISIKTFKQVAQLLDILTSAKDTTAVADSLYSIVDIILCKNNNVPAEKINLLTLNQLTEIVNVIAEKITGEKTEEKKQD